MRRILLALLALVGCAPAPHPTPIRETPPSAPPQIIGAAQATERAATAYIGRATDAAAIERVAAMVGTMNAALDAMRHARSHSAYMTAVAAARRAVDALRGYLGMR
jgi:hypothetical protein